LPKLRRYPRLKRNTIFAAVARWEVLWEAATSPIPGTLGASGGQRNRKWLKVNMNNRSERAEQ
jgi:hypothetical protein